MKRKKLYFAAFVFCFLLVLCSYQTTYAKTKDVTQKFQDKKKVSGLCNCIRDYVAYEDTYVLKIGKTESLNFSKETDRRKVLPYYKSYASKVNMKKASLKIFGKKTSTKGLQHLIGEWGATGPDIRISKIYKTGSKNYRILCNLVWIDEENHSTKSAQVTYWIQKRKSAQYGYYIKKLKIKKTGNWF